MTLLVPFDGSDLSETALERALEFAAYLEEPVVALSVLPPDAAEFATERGWVGDDESYDVEVVRDRLEAQVAGISDRAQFRCEIPDEGSPVADVTTDVVRTIRRVADELDTRIVFIGSENAGRVSTPVTSVGAPVSEDPGYDVHIVRHAE